jgi:hypothetical protein
MLVVFGEIKLAGFWLPDVTMGGAPGMFGTCV